MKNLVTIFKSLNLTYSRGPRSEDVLVTNVQYINSPDGSVRWMWPSQLKKPLFLKFYSITSYKSRIIALVIRLVFLLRLQKYVFKNIHGSLSQTNELSLIDYTKNNWALFTGTSGPNRKVMVYKETEEGNSFFKIGLNSKSNSLIKNETETLSHLDSIQTKSFVYPKLIQSGKNHVEVTDISIGGKRNTSLSPIHIKALKELNESSSQFNTIGSLTVWKQLKIDLENLKLIEDIRIPKGLLKKVSFLMDLINDSAIIETSCCHGDFTPWNMFETNGRLHIYDWELYKEQMPFGFDALHFIIQNGILIDRKPWAEIEKEINKKFDKIALGVLSNAKATDKRLYLRLYLISNIIFSLNIFQKQKDWHEQIHWSLKTWNEAVSSTLANLVKHRSLLLMDVFDFLLNKPYAALKFPDVNPERLPDLSDADLCVDQKTSKVVFSYLKTHPLVLKCKMINKSYMMVLELICKDGSQLSIDLIWELRRKSIVLMEVQTLIQRAVLNDFQVKISRDEDLGRFISLFYISNGVAAPLKYLKFTKTLKTSKNSFDQKVYQIAIDDQLKRGALMKMLNNQPINSELQRIKNGFLFLIDTVKEALNRPGMIITFSGVDGAGKSTIIEEVKYIIEKKLRRRVVVIRHRPSILPILSAWTKGKKVAESEAALRLPRQGRNSSILSSFLRFSYYYIDYVFGQFVVFIKYKLRGFVVLYDRYYFDFINDSKRSNIKLPSFFTRAGYSLLLKPNLNFFLYADPKLIRSRKKELDSKTIEKLTAKYKSLFEELNERDSLNRYISIENIDLNTTLTRVVNRVDCLNSYAI
ncbi:MAG: thymidylate kinase [Saprospiraceae bacterium]|jgi:thymidylate kinase